ncbi:hypothetical protein U3516DRAFT_821742 [Neocallimastix sp. 'constans']
MKLSESHNKNGESLIINIGVKKGKEEGDDDQNKVTIKVPVVQQKSQMNNTINNINEKLEEILSHIKISNENVEKKFNTIENLYGNINTNFEKNLNLISEEFQKREDQIKISHKKEQETHETEKAALTQTISNYKEKIDEMTNEINRLKEFKKYFRKNFTNSANVTWNYSEDDVTLTDKRTCLYIGNSSFIEHIHGPCLYAVWHCGPNSDTQSIYYNGQELLSDGFYRQSLTTRIDSTCTSWIYDCEFINQ